MATEVKKQLSGRLTTVGGDVRVCHRHPDVLRSAKEAAVLGQSPIGSSTSKSNSSAREELVLKLPAAADETKSSNKCGGEEGDVTILLEENQSSSVAAVLEANYQQQIIIQDVGNEILRSGVNLLKGDQSFADLLVVCKGTDSRISHANCARHTNHLLSLLIVTVMLETKGKNLDSYCPGNRCR